MKDEYYSWIADWWHTLPDSSRTYSKVDDYRLDGEDNSIYLSAQMTVQTKYPELYDYWRKPTFVVEF